MPVPVPQASSSSSLDRSIPVSDLAPDTYTVLATAKARLYHQKFGALHHDWKYSRLRGTLIFGNISQSSNSDSEVYWFRLVDETSVKTVWKFELPMSKFVYTADKPFFHVFPGQSRMFGFAFGDDDEAVSFCSEVRRRTRSEAIPKPQPSPAKRKQVRFTSKSSRSAGLSTSVISAPSPDSFVHLAHIGVDENGGFQVKNLGTEWTNLLSALQGHGVSENAVAENVEFVEGFIAGAKAMSASRRNSEDAVSTK